MLQPTLISDLVDNVMKPGSFSSPATVPAVSMLQPLYPRLEGALSTLPQYPTCLGNPASVLPFLTAQANNVISLASSGNQGSAPSSGNGMAPSSQSSCSDSSVKNPVGLDLSGGCVKNPVELNLTDGCGKSPELPVGLDLGNGWKVVGLTSLPDLSVPTPAPLPVTAQTLPVNSISSHSMTPHTSSGVTSQSHDVNQGGCVVNAPSLPSSLQGEWKVVGLTSLDATTPISCNSKPAPLPVQDLEASSSTGLSAGGETMEQSEKYTGISLGNNPDTNLQVPSLAEIAAGTSDWKIAGVTTLVAPGGTVAGSGLLAPVEARAASSLVAPMAAAASCAPDKAQTTSGDAACPLSTLSVPAPNTTDKPEWKIVGVTSLNSQTLSSPPVMATASSVSPIPVVMASPAPLMSVPPSVSKEAEWKVVGVVPLPHNEHSLPTSTDSPMSSQLQTSARVSEPCHPIELDNLDLQRQRSTSNTTKEQSAEGAEQPPNTSSPLTPKRNQASGFKSHDDHSHPLAFLKNCSSQLRNAVLKRNTVSTMLELKRAFKHTGQGDKWQAFVEQKHLLSLSKHEHQKLMCSAMRQLSGSKTRSGEFVSGRRRSSGGSPVSSFQQQRSVDCVRQQGLLQRPGSSTGQNKSCCDSSSVTHRHMHTNQVTPQDSDDKQALLMAYKHSITPDNVVLPRFNPENHDTVGDVNLSYSISHSHPFYSNTKDGALVETRRFSGPVHPIKMEEGQAAMTIPVFDSERVNLTNVDPWGVCTDEDLDEIAEMMTEKEDNRIHHSSSRKRKLSTPRKMIQ